VAQKGLIFQISSQLYPKFFGLKKTNAKLGPVMSQKRAKKISLPATFYERGDRKKKQRKGRKQTTVADQNLSHSPRDIVHKLPK